MKQKFSSKNTCINTTKVPAIYSKLNLEKLRNKIMFDYGAGRIETVRLIRALLEPYDIDYIPYDPYNLSEGDNCYAWENRLEADIYICSNVLNVIKEDDIVQEIIDDLTNWSTKPDNNNKVFFFKIYEGDKSSIGKKSKNDCWQRNQRTKEYLNFNWDFMYPTIYKGFITNQKGKELLK